MKKISYKKLAENILVDAYGEDYMNSIVDSVLYYYGEKRIKDDKDLEDVLKKVVPHLHTLIDGIVEDYHKTYITEK